MHFTGNGPLRFEEVGRFPAPGDNSAIAIQTLPAGTSFFLGAERIEVPHTILEGHRFAARRIAQGERLLSWGLPFGLATRSIHPGEYLCNGKILEALNARALVSSLPLQANFVDHRLPFTLAKSQFTAGTQVRAESPGPTFQGFLREGDRGAGTRNYVILLGTNSRTAGFVRALATRFRNISDRFANVDGVVAVEHTEGGSDGRPNNFELIVRTLAGFVLNPNVGAALCVDYGGEILSNSAVREKLPGNAEDDPPVDWFSIHSSFESALAEGERKVHALLQIANRSVRRPLPASFLRLGLQCGGSDAFSGISANPLAGILAREVVAHGGSANLAETSELIGAESYILANVRDYATAAAFIRARDRFQEWAGWHGHSAEGNPSGGNMFRGLYNIVIKSIGAARKKDPAVRLDYVIEYAGRMRRPGFYFMDSPGNDLESIAGQVAAGCNMILFATGNGSITNFPFVPTIKIMSTTGRYELVRAEMDFNAGRYQDGEPLEMLGCEAFGDLIAAASGRRTAGERAGHSQVQLWRDWRQAGPGPVPASIDAPVCRPAAAAPKTAVRVQRAALVLPTSLCSGQIAGMIAARLSASGRMRAVALPHTEGCGNSGGESEELFIRTMAGYLAHPLARRALLLEHGCEKTHNDAFRKAVRELHLSESEFGWASVQMDGGIDRVISKATAWLDSAPDRDPEALLGVAFAGRGCPAGILEHLKSVSARIQGAGGFVVSPQGFGIPAEQKLRYGERALSPGRHEMDMPAADMVEIITGLVASGAQLVVVFDDRSPVAENPLAPTLQLASREELRPDVDWIAGDGFEKLDQLIEETLRGQYVPRSRVLGNSAFQITRGRTGISL